MAAQLVFLAEPEDKRVCQSCLAVCGSLSVTFERVCLQTEESKAGQVDLTSTVLAPLVNILSLSTHYSSLNLSGPDTPIAGMK
jgi:hypothetical protein